MIDEWLKDEARHKLGESMSEIFECVSARCYVIRQVRLMRITAVAPDALARTVEVTRLDVVMDISLSS